MCVIYLAEITNRDRAATGDHVVVKFVSSYGEKAHEFLAHQGRAPTLRYCGPLCKETGLSNDFPGPAQSAPPGLHLRSNMRMVVMDYIDALPQKEAPQDACEQIRKVLTALHTNGFVFGDLRPPNILFDKDKKVKLIDFDWSGRFDMKDSNNLVDGLQEQSNGNMDRAEVGDGPYAHYPLQMSTIPDMWAPGMKPLAPIRPQHDRMMMDKLPWQ
jgi:serine/threonine protein kinase